MFVRQHALHGHALLPPTCDAGPLLPQQPGVSVSLLAPFACLMQISAFAAEVDAAGARLAQLLALDLPAPNRSSGPTRRCLRAVGPGVWHLVGDWANVCQGGALRQALDGLATVVDLGHARVAFLLHGLDASRLLAQFCALDLDVSRFPTGSATLTRFGQVGAALARFGDGPSFELHVARGYAGFVLESLALAAQEYEVPVDLAPPGT